MHLNTPADCMGHILSSHMLDTEPLVYLVFGIPNSGRREVIFDLIEGGIPENEQIIYFRPQGEAACAYDEQIEALDNVRVVGWNLKDCKVTHGKISAAPKKILFLAPGLSDPSDCAEGLKSWSDHNNCQIARLIRSRIATSFQSTQRQKLGLMPASTSQMLCYLTGVKKRVTNG